MDTKSLMSVNAVSPTKVIATPAVSPAPVATQLVKVAAPVSTAQSVVDSVVKQEPPVLDKLVQSVANLFSPEPKIEPKIEKETNMASAGKTDAVSLLGKSSISASKSTIISTPPVEAKTSFQMPSLVSANKTFVAASDETPEPAWLTSYKSQCASKGGKVKLWGAGLYGSVDLALAASQKLAKDGCVKVGVGSGDYKGQDVYCCPGASSGQTQPSEPPPKQFVQIETTKPGAGTEVIVDPEVEPGVPPAPIGPAIMAPAASPAFGRYLVLGGAGAVVGAVGAKVMKKKMLVPTLVGLGLGFIAAFFMSRGQSALVTPGPASEPVYIPSGGDTGYIE